MIRGALTIVAACVAVAAPAAAQRSRMALSQAELAAAVAAPGRPAAAVALDEVRKPAEVLRFLGLRRGDRVLDYFAGNGYYSEIAARAVGPRGVVVGWNSQAFGENPDIRAALQGIRERNRNTAFYATPNTALSFPPASFDFALLHLVYHDSYWESARFRLPRIDPNTVTRALFDAVRPGGIVAVIDHVANPNADARAEVEARHRIDPAVLRADFERAGFVLEAESNLLRNPDDDHSRNVFDPTIRGRTDRVVYRFRRPAR
jgi:predicted methyltransferase